MVMDTVCLPAPPTLDLAPIEPGATAGPPAPDTAIEWPIDNAGAYDRLLAAIDGTQALETADVACEPGWSGLGGV